MRTAQRVTMRRSLSVRTALTTCSYTSGCANGRRCFDSISLRRVGAGTRKATTSSGLGKEAITRRVAWEGVPVMRFAKHGNAEWIVEILIDLKAPGCQWLYLVPKEGGL